MIELPMHVAASLGLSSAVELEQLREAIRLRAPGAGPLFSSDGGKYFVSIVETPETVEIEIGEPLYPRAQWHYREVNLDANRCARVVEVPSGEVADLPPVEAERLLLRAWMVSARVCTDSGQLRRNIVVIEWQPGLSEAIKEYVRGLVAVRPTTPRGHGGCVWKTATIVDFRSGTRAFSHKEATLLRRLFVEACTEDVARWRFLSFYRILEHGYLESVLSGLTTRFYSEPKDALDSAQGAIKSEVEQLVRLVESHNLQAYFEEIWKINEWLIGNLNQFAILVKREADKKQYADLYKRGVAICYQVRCAIVHAGYAVVFDRSPGAEEALSLHLPELERAVVHFLGIETV
jgi:hypothetical protein